MKLIDLTGNSSFVYRTRATQDSKVPMVWRHDRLNQSLAGEKYKDLRQCPPYRAEEVNGFHETN